MTLHSPRTAIMSGELLADAFSNLYALRQRSALALLGVIIGVAAVVAMLTIGHNAEREAARQFSQMGVDLMVVQQSRVPAGSPGLTAGVLESLPGREPVITAAAPLGFGRADVRIGDRKVNAGLLAATPALQGMIELTVRQGRFINAFDADRTFAVIGSGIAEKLSSPGRPATIGDQVKIGRYQFTIVGVLKPSRPMVMLPINLDDSVIVPLEAGRRVEAPVNGAIARMGEGVNDIMATAAVTEDIKQRVRGIEVQVQSARQLVEAAKAQMAVHTRLLAGIGGVSLLVGGVGVMNVMLMSVMERRREIGLRAALGARPSDIRTMFYIEALALSLAGGVAGATVGLFIAWVMAVTSGWTFSPALYALPLGVGVATIVGLIFGIYPAVRASRLDPITALRSE